MKPSRRFSILLFVAALVVTTLACGGTAAAPTNTAPPPPTNTLPPPPTNTPLPPPTNTPIPPPTNTPAPTNGTGPNIVAGQINVREVSGFTDESNYWYLFGLVSNDTDRAVNDIEVEVQFLDATGAVLYSETTSTALFSLAPGEQTPFIFYSYEAVIGVETFVATVVGNGTTDLIRANLDISGVTVWYDPNFNEVYVSGNVTNNNADPVEINGLAGTLVDASGAVVSAETAYPYLYHLEPGVSGPFTILFDTPTGQGSSLTNYAFYIDAEFVNAANVLDVVISDQNHTYLDNSEDYHLVGTFTNNSSIYLNARLVAGLYDAAGNCIDSTSLYLPVAVAPGESMPYDFYLWGPTNWIVEAYNASTSYQIFVDWYSTYEAYVAPYVITTSEDANTYDGYSANFTGNVVNNSGRDLDSITVVVTLYDKATGELTATNYTYVSGPITNTGTAAYDMYVYVGSDFDPANVEFTISAYGQ
jgi:hypothetical protein